VTQDGVLDLGAHFANIGIDVSPYLDGVQYFADATSLGREADFASTWINSGFDAAFLISYKDDKKIKVDGTQGDIDVNLAAIPEPTNFGSSRPRPRWPWLKPPQARGLVATCDSEGAPLRRGFLFLDVLGELRECPLVARDRLASPQCVGRDFVQEQVY
jgi:hypothetical protein